MKHSVGSFELVAPTIDDIGCLLDSRSCKVIFSNTRTVGRGFSPVELFEHFILSKFQIDEALCGEGFPNSLRRRLKSLCDQSRIKLCTHSSDSLSTHLKALKNTRSEFANISSVPRTAFNAEEEYTFEIVETGESFLIRPSKNHLFELIISQLLNANDDNSCLFLLTDSDVSGMRDVDRAVRVFYALTRSSCKVHHLRVPWEAVGREKIDLALQMSSFVSYRSDVELKLGGDRSREYIHFNHFTNHAWPDFAKEQKHGAEELSKQISNRCGYDVTAVIDIGCGQGDVLRHLHENFSAIKLIGVDHCEWDKGPVIAPTEKLSFHYSQSFSGYEVPHDIDGVWALLFTGNTLPHIGAVALRNWLQKNRNNLPKHIFFDFSTYWREMLANRFCRDPGTSPARPIKISKSAQTNGVAISFTVVEESQIRRTMQLQWFKSDECIGKQTFSLTQFPDPPEAYKQVLQMIGYKVTEVTRYKNGWGMHDLFHAEIGASKQFAWPVPRDKRSHAINNYWYDTLVSVWNRINPHDKHQGTVGNFKFFPVALLPFDSERVFARYILPKSADGFGNDNDTVDMNQVWMWLADERDPNLARGSVSKPENEMPYACGFYKVILGDVPSSFIRHLDPKRQSEIGLSFNQIDNRFFQNEMRMYCMKDVEVNKTGHFAFPLYYMGMPLFLVVVEDGDLQKKLLNLPPDLVHNILRHEAQVLEDQIEKQWKWIDWENFLQQVFTESSPHDLRSLLLSVEKGRNWGHWLFTVPGKCLHDTEPFANKWETFRSKHEECCSLVESAPYYRMSEKLKDKRFFVSSASEGCGHEFVTKQHRARSVSLAEDAHSLELMCPESKIIKYALVYLQRLSTTDDSLLPETDELHDNRSYDNSAYESENQQFQKFKSLFCRKGENEEADYRLSAVTILAAEDAFMGKNFLEEREINGDENWAQAKHASAKVVIEDSWKWLSLFWTWVHERARPQSMHIDTNGRDVISIMITFKDKLPFSRAGSGITQMLKGAKRICRFASDAPNDECKHLKITLTNGEVMGEWLYPTS